MADDKRTARNDSSEANDRDLDEVSGGALTDFGISVSITPSPTGPIPIPYPSTGTVSDTTKK